MLITQFPSEKISKLATIIFLLFFTSIPFSNAPGYLHHAITLPSILSFCVISIWFLRLVVINRIRIDSLYIFAAFVLSFFLISFVFTTTKNIKVINYFLAHCWFIVLIVAITDLVRWQPIQTQHLVYLISAGLIITGIWMCFEAFLPIIVDPSIDIGRIIPRVTRMSYAIDSGFGFYRARGFNYESAYLAIYLNTSFCFLFALSKFPRYLLFTFWALALFLTVSLAQIALFAIFWFIVLLLSLRRLNKVILLRVPFSFNNIVFSLEKVSSHEALKYWQAGACAIIFMAVYGSEILYFVEAFYYWFLDNSMGDSISALQRLEKMQIAFAFFESLPINGIGFGGIQMAGVDGISSFYGSVIIQLGLLGVPLFIFLGYFGILSFLTRNVWVIGCFFFVFGHLVIIDPFYLPQVFLPFILLAIVTRSGDGMEGDY